MPDIIKIMLDIIEKPRAKKPYRDMAQYYRTLEMQHEAEAIETLINIFTDNGSNYTPVNKQ